MMLPGIHYPCPKSSQEDVDRVYDQIDDLLLAGRFEEVDGLLEQVDVAQCSITIMLSYLTITFAPKSRLKNRDNLYQRVSDRIKVIDPARLDRLLGGLR